MQYVDIALSKVRNELHLCVYLCVYFHITSTRMYSTKQFNPFLRQGDVGYTGMHK